VCVRYGNVLASRGSVIPLFHEQIRSGGPVTITTSEMTRFLLSLDEAVETVVAALETAEAGETLVPSAPSANVVDVATALIGYRPIETVITGIRPGEKLHEIMVSEEEAPRTIQRGRWYAIRAMLPELTETASGPPALTGEYSSESPVLTPAETLALLTRHALLLDDVREDDPAELLR
jgi:FlaA1/EpsC-like NDP-sugar epimerase